MNPKDLSFARLSERIARATCLQDLIVRKAPHNFPATDDAEVGQVLIQVLRVLEANFPRSFTIKELAELSGVSPKTVRIKLTEIEYTFGLISDVIRGVRYYRLKEITNAGSESVSLSRDSRT